MEIDYGKMDPNIRELVRLMNLLPGIETTGSCGGHLDPEIFQCPLGKFSITFDVRRTKAGWLSLERLAWATFSGPLMKFGNIHPHSSPPYMNTPGRTMFFAWDGMGDPEDAAKAVQQELLACPAPKGSIKPQVMPWQPDEAQGSIKAILEYLREYPDVEAWWNREIHDRMAERQLDAVFIRPATLSLKAVKSIEFLVWLNRALGFGDFNVLALDDPWRSGQQSLFFLWNLPTGRLDEINTRAREERDMHFID